MCQSLAPPSGASRAFAEVCVALLCAIGFAYWSGSVDDDPIRRVGQISGLAALQLRLAVVGLPLVAVAAHRRARRYAYAGVAGLATGFLAGGQVFALRGTPWPINGEYGDNGALLRFAREAMATGSTHSFYPPLVPYLLDYGAELLTHGQPAFALKTLLIAALAITGPAAYLAWRLCLGPLPALAAALVSALPQTMPYKSYSTLVLVMVVPLLAKLLLWLREGAALRGAALGAGLGLLFVTYSGWLVWAAPGALAAVLCVFPWRTPHRAALLLATTAAGFLAVAGRYALVLLRAHNVKDAWCSPITLTQPGYLGPLPFAQSAWDRPGLWPPMGEFAGLGFLTLALLAGLGTAVALGLRRPTVIAPLAVLGGAWIARFWIAHRVEHDAATQLFPRTTGIIQVCLCVLTVLAAALLLEHPRRTPEFGAVGLLLALLLGSGLAGSALTDQYLPERPQLGTAGGLTWFAHELRRPDGGCPPYAPDGRCRTPAPPGPLPSGDADYATTATPPRQAFLRQCDYPWRRGYDGHAHG